MRTLLLTGILMLLGIPTLFAQNAVAPTTGNGTLASPYQISQWEQLYWITAPDAEVANPSRAIRATYHYRQTADISFPSDIDTWDGGAGWLPVSNFSGSYNGDNYTITGLYINRPSENDIGLFANTMDVTADIFNLKLADVNVSGSMNVGAVVGSLTRMRLVNVVVLNGVVDGAVYVGGLAGQIYSLSNIINSGNNATVQANSDLGGLVGRVNGNTSIQRSYNRGNILAKGTNVLRVGGLTGELLGTINNSYNLGEITVNLNATASKSVIGGLVGGAFSGASIIRSYASTSMNFTGGSEIGGLVGMQVGSSATSSFWNTSMYSGSSALGTGVTTQDLQNPSTLINTGWDFANETANGTDDYWGINSNENSGMPFLMWEGTQNLFGLIAAPTSGDGSSANPWVVSNTQHLMWISAPETIISSPSYAERMSAHYVQSNDINFSVQLADYDGGKGFVPIGSFAVPFSGSYNGQNYQLTNLVINRPDEDYVALFRRASSSAVLQNIRITVENITGANFVGSILGEGSATLRNVRMLSAPNLITGTNMVGGLVGRLSAGGRIANSTSLTQLSASEIAGGIAGESYGAIDSVSSEGSITNYDRVTSNYIVGGLVGIGYGGSSIHRSFSTLEMTNALTANTFATIGGLAGQLSGGVTINDSYFNGIINGLGSPSEVQRIAGLAAVMNLSIAGANQINRVYVTGELNGGGDRGGLFAFVPGSTGSLTGSGVFWNAEAMNQATTQGSIGTSVNTAALQVASTFINAGWDFMDETSNGTADIWGINPIENSSYPFLSWQGFSNVVEVSQFQIPASGTGTAADPYIISTWQNLMWIIGDDNQSAPVSRASRWAAHYRQNADISFPASISTFDDNKGFLSIGNINNQFTGSYDGQNHKIVGLIINRPTELNVGLFGQISSNSVVKNLILEDADVKGNYSVGAVVGYNNGIVRNVHVTGNSVVSTELEFAGGVVGTNATSNAVVARSSSAGNVYTKTAGGGIAGYNEGRVDSSFSSGLITHQSTASVELALGGLVGSNGGQVLNSYSTARIESSLSSSINLIGGLIGSMFSNKTLANSYFNGEIVAPTSTSQTQHLGGLIGSLFRTQAGTFTITRSYASGTMVGAGERGGIVGGAFNNQGTLSFTNNVWNTTTLNQASTYENLGSGKTDAEMKEYDTFRVLGFDFLEETANGSNDYWGISPDENGGYPFLAWQGLTHVPPPALFVAPTVGNGTSGNPYQISTWQHLMWITASNADVAVPSVNARWNAHYVQTADIAFPANMDTFNNGQGWSPIGNSSTQFWGTYNGAGFKIANLVIHRTSNEIGLFGRVSGTVSNVTLENVTISGNNRTGAVVGTLVGTLLNAQVTGTSSVVGVEDVGGLVGASEDGSILRRGSSVATVETKFNRAGGLVGISFGGIIDSSFTTGVVRAHSSFSGSEVELGGLVGATVSIATIRRSFSTAEIRTNGINPATIRLGGLLAVAIEGTTIENSYFKGTIEGPASPTSTLNSGGIVGTIVITGSESVIMTSVYAAASMTGGGTKSGLVANKIGMGGGSVFQQGSFWDTEVSGVATTFNNSGTGRTSAQMKSADTFLGAGWDFIGESTNGTSNIWGINEDAQANDGYPFLSWQGLTHYITPPISVYHAPTSGDGTAGNPFQISTWQNLMWIAAPNSEVASPNEATRLASHYIQTADIAFPSDFNTFDDDKGFLPIGRSIGYFSGSYDGQNHKISGLVIHRPSVSSLGLFGRASSTSLIKNLVLEDVDIKGNQQVGAVVGENEGILRNVHVIGDSFISSEEGVVGGLVGINSISASLITRSSAAVTVYTRSTAGGIIGSNYGRVDSSYSAGLITHHATSLSGSIIVGGLVGINFHEVNASYSAARVESSQNSFFNILGGLIGNGQVNSSLTNSYFNGEIIAPVTPAALQRLGGLIGMLARFSAGTYTITKSYANGTMVGGGERGGIIGGVSGSDGTLALSNNIWNATTLNQATTYLNQGIAKTDAEMKQYSTFVDLGYDFLEETANGSNDYWGINPDENGGYPFLAWQGLTHNVPVPEFAGGDGSSANPYLIANKQQLNNVRNHLNAHFRVTADIAFDNSDFESGGNYYNGGNGWTPFGTDANQFNGSFDGQYFTISNLKVLNTTTNFKGFFGVIGATAVVQRVNVQGVVEGRDHVGGLVGHSVSGSSIQKSSFSGTVTSTSSFCTAVTGDGIRVGGLVGWGNGNITESWANTDITAACGAVGGLVGFVNFNGSPNPTITDSYALGTITQSSSIYSASTAGLLGFVGPSTVQRVYSAVSGTNIGNAINGTSYGSGPTISQAYYDASVSPAGSFSGTALNATTAKQEASFVGFDFTTLWGINPNENSGYPFLRWQGFTHIEPAIVVYEAPTSGNGTAGSPYQISSWQNLMWIGAPNSEVGSPNQATRWAAHYVQTEDITFPALLSTLYNDQGWLPLGTEVQQFTGSYDGGNFAIEGLVINRSASHVGFFGYAQAATIKNIRFVDASVSANDVVGIAIGGIYGNSTIENVHVVGGTVTGTVSVGGLAGNLNGGTTITTSSTTAAVTGNMFVGGFSGILGGASSISRSFSYGTVQFGSSPIQTAGGFVGGILDGTVIDSYSRTTVTGGSVSNIGGFVGDIQSGPATLTRVYAAGSVTGTGSDRGGLVGVVNSSVTATQSFWDTQSTGQANSAAGVGRTTAQMRDHSLFISGGWDFVEESANGTQNIWGINTNNTNETNNGYPFLAWQGLTHFVAVPVFAGGDGTAGNPYLIANVQQLNNVRDYLSAHFTLTTDIAFTSADFASGGLFHNAGAGWEPIGTLTSLFTGNFNGNGHQITGVVVSRSGDEAIGFFGALGQNGVIRNVTVSGSVIGGNRTGGLLGYSDINSEVRNSSFTGTVSGSANAIRIGGLIGHSDGNVFNSFANSTVSASNGALGGLIGFLNFDRHIHPTVEDVYALGTVTQTNASQANSTGGLIGFRGPSQLRRAFTSVSGTNLGDAMWAFDYQSFLPKVNEHQYFDSSVSPVSSNKQNVTALSGNALRNQASYTGFDFDTVWQINSGVTHPFLRDLLNQRINAAITLTGMEGYRMMASPIAGLSYNQLLDGLWIQGMSNASTPAGLPNIYTWDISQGGNWVAVTDANQTVSDGGFLVYVYEDDDVTQPGVQGGFPKNIQAIGSEGSEKTVTLNATPEAWTLVGNPFANSIAWNNLNRGNGVGNAVYVYDGSNWITYNGSVGALSNGHIAAFQAFFVYSLSSGTRSLEITNNARVSGQNFIGKTQQPHMVELKLSGQGMQNSGFLHFHDQGQLGIDPYDAFKMQPFSQQYVQVLTKASQRTLDINSLPMLTEVTEIPIEFIVTQSGVYELSFSSVNVPSGWNLMLWDRDTNQRWSATQGTTVSLNLNGSQAKAAELLGEPEEVTATDESDRFVLIVGPGTVTSLSPNDGAEVPTELSLLQNYPNPFNPSTMIAFTLPRSADVRLEVFDISGRKVATVLNEYRQAGTYEVSFDASRLASGLYYYRLMSGGQQLTKKMTLLK